VRGLRQLPGLLGERHFTVAAFLLPVETTVE
jgi:hypothetical protein